MKIIISPAKKMKSEPDLYPCSGLPVFLDKTRELAKWMKKLTFQEAKELWKCNDAIARENYQRFQSMELEKNLTPAILSYEGIQYQYMAPSVFEGKEIAYIQEHLCILSGFYGALRPLDGVTPYRLEMQAKAAVAGTRDLYEFWGDAICRAVTAGEGTVLNLASKEYARREPWPRWPGVRWCGIWRRQEPGSLRTPGDLTIWDTGSGKTFPDRRNMYS